MKKINYQPTILFALLIALSGVLFSFSFKTAETISSYKNNFGGEGFEVYLNDKLVLQQYGEKMDKLKPCNWIKVQAMVNWLSGIIIAENR